MKALSIQSLYKIYKNGLSALNGISLDVNQGDFFALLGANGAGKSTTIGIITSLVTKTSGTVKLFGHDIDHEFEQAKACVGIVPQEFNFSIFENCFNIVMNQAGYYGLRRKTARQQAEYYLKKLDLWDKRDNAVRELSGGMKRRLMIARALVHEPKLLILDEPTAGVDIEIRHSMWDFLRDINSKGTTVILTTHYFEEAENLCRNIAIIDRGAIVTHTSMRELLDQLTHEKFVLYLEKPLSSAPELKAFKSCLVDATTLEIEIHKDQTINELLAALSAQNINILSMKNKANRLETYFLGMLKKGEEISDA
ncbi:MAG: ABC transporter ATP-binding protein [Gammaproteobacteria bacterium]